MSYEVGLSGLGVVVLVAVGLTVEKVTRVVREPEEGVTPEPLVVHGPEVPRSRPEWGRLLRRESFEYLTISGK